MMKKQIFILLVYLITHSTIGQNSYENDSISFDKIVTHFEESFGWDILSFQKNDSVSTSSLYKTDEFNLSISKDPIAFDTNHLVLENPYYTDDFEDYDDNLINYPVSYSVIYDNKLVSLFRNGKFVCYNLEDLKRDLDFESKLNTRKFKYHWIVNNKLGARSGNTIYAWKNNKWIKPKTKFPLKKRPKLFEDSDFVVFGDCHGEWGGTVYFFEKSTGNYYFTESTCANSVIKKDGEYFILAQLGHMEGSSNVILIEDPRKLTKAKRGIINKMENGKALGYSDKSEAYDIIYTFFGIQLFSTFKYGEKQLYLSHINELTFLTEIKGKEIRIVHPLFNNEFYTHNPITNSYGNHTLINLDLYGTARDREVSVIIVNGNQISKLDWNENHNR